jgi:hypothetical protein
LGGAVVTLVLFPLPASAFHIPGSFSCPFIPNFSYGFDGSGWTAAREDWFEDGEDVWNTVWDKDGDIVAFAVDGGSVEIKINDALDDGQGGLYPLPLRSDPHRNRSDRAVRPARPC